MNNACSILSRFVDDMDIIFINSFYQSILKHFLDKLIKKHIYYRYKLSNRQYPFICIYAFIIVKIACRIPYKRSEESKLKVSLHYQKNFTAILLAKRFSIHF